MLRLSALTALLLLFFAAPLWAEDDEQEDSAAAKIFRDAWWAETGSGALDEAVDGYRKAIAAKGSDAIRARALYRMAVVLQRMGKTEDGVRALERLAKEFPAENALLAKAKERLDEWTAEDLRTSFSEWYRRYQYSPEFQAKIVDLVLKLGSRERKVSEPARQELLTIGEPAVAALTAHTTSPNPSLRNAATLLLVKIGTLPPPAALWNARGWEGDDDFWKLLESSKDPVRAAFAKEAAASKDDRAPWIIALLAGPDAVLDTVAKETHDTGSVTTALLAPLMRTTRPTAFWARLRGIAMDSDVHFRVRQWIAGRLIHLWHDARGQGEKKDITGLTTEELLRWVGTEELRQVVLPFLRKGALPASDAWRVVAQAVLELPGNRREQKELVAAMCGQLRIAPADADLRLATRAFKHVLAVRQLDGLDLWPVGDGEGMVGSGSRPRAALAQAITEMTGKTLRYAPPAWWRQLRGRDGVFEALLAWMRDAAEPEVRLESAQIVANEIAQGVARMTSVLTAEDRRRELRTSIFRNLGQNPRLGTLDWDVESLTLLVETALTWGQYDPGKTRTWRAGGQSQGPQIVTSLDTPDATLFAQLLTREPTRTLLFDAAFAAPERFPPAFWGLLGQRWSADAGNRRMALDLIRKHWKDWTPAQRGPGLRLFVTKYLLGKGDAEGNLFLREVLTKGEVDAGTRLHLVKQMSQLTLADLKTIYDFTRVEDVDQATYFLGRMPKDEATFDAFLPALRPDGEDPWVVYRHFDEGPESRVHLLARELLQHPEAYDSAEELLRARDRAVDLPIWIEMLGHRDTSIRLAAAKALGNLYNQDAIKALARAVDDPDPGVRDAVLASLERIDKIEKQKERWRKYGKER